ncbi:MAG TPA: wax ester/triacylglycerol synthase family O-acyltransferase [Actinomycetota bacterium]
MGGDAVERVGPQDASFFYLETPSVHQHVAGVQILDPSTGPTGEVRFDDVVRLIESRLHLAPRFRQKVVFPPIPAARPVWVDDVDFNIQFHMRRAALPAPGGRAELADFVQRVISRPLDRSKPLWELYVIEGMEDGLSAILSKVHHAMIDGIAAMDIATVLFDFSPKVDIGDPPEWTPEPPPHAWDLLNDAIREGIAHPMRELTDAVQLALEAPMLAARQVGHTVSGIRDILGLGVTPPSPLNRRVGPNRRFAMAEAPVQDFKDVKNALGGTVNDVVLATTAGALHRLFHERRLPTRGRTLRAFVPVSVRGRNERGALGNHLSTLFVELPIGPMSARSRLSTIRATTKNLKESHQAVGAEFLMNIGVWAPPTIHAMAARLAARTPMFNLVVSNVPGPQIPLYICGAKLLAFYPIMPLAETVGLSVAVTSLAGTMAFGLTGDWDTMPDIDELADAVHDSIAELKKAAGS